MRRGLAAMALATLLDVAACTHGPIAAPPPPAVPLSNVLNQIKLELAEYNRQAAATPIRGNACNNNQDITMTLAGVKVEVQTTLAIEGGAEIGANVPAGPIPVVIGPSASGSRSSTNRQTTVLNFTLAPPGRGTRSRTTADTADMHLLKALLEFRKQLATVNSGGQCLQFAQDGNRANSIALDFTAEEVIKGGLKVTILVLTVGGSTSRTATDQSTITVTLDMKGAVLIQ
ncbi:hypothetical protein [Roseicella aquatilis]|uniref:hypothetical protein n=1 Tax=Roseicella aquatilis TaxID=2527868 RepID=UPI001051B326|nr:hypothetical protein [Roseicella aquatilis]